MRSSLLGRVYSRPNHSTHLNGIPYCHDDLLGTVIRSQAEVLGVENLSEFDASTRTANSKAAPASHEEAKEGVREEEGWVAEGATVSGVPVQWFRHFGTAVPPPECASPGQTGVSKDDDSLLIVLANEYLLRVNSYSSKSMGIA